MRKALYKKRADGYLCRSEEIRPELFNVIKEIKDQLPETVIFGGFVREALSKRLRGFSSDMDLVTRSSFNEIFHVIEKYNPSKNKFGGFRFSINDYRFDIWSLESTWAFRVGIICCNGFEDLLKTTFFNKDAAFYHLKNRELVLSSECGKAFDDGFFDINLEKNPNPEGVAKKAIDYYCCKERISRRLATYIIKNTNTDGLSDFKIKLLRRLQQDLEMSSKDVFVIQPDLFEKTNGY